MEEYSKELFNFKVSSIKNFQLGDCINLLDIDMADQ
jgi:hypothetical protein